MGRTNRTFRDLLCAIERRWGDYRRALRRDDRSRFDRLFGYAREHADAASYLNHETPLFPVVVAISLEQEKRLDELADRIEAVEDGGDDGGDEDDDDGDDDGRPSAATPAEHADAASAVASE